ncbi:hypothetical protein CEUSTIGMA_g12479.t1 [Chlamydomonas eustigma]|uniref:adenylate kinase n=1 Tax=Chlamydomonas eustigma TaxID=1157962 RepID=A0A250XQ37_9CHLO|nr:hypothetical protein CEUSTIGMA_g12479.t1 [Chlamydomonas eustigma]|eukprot:GAX85059.1 hypothetical protein CEUSTIGMA_g12479.t1 [Chlamydomonas eustigma]
MAQGFRGSIILSQALARALRLNDLALKAGAEYASRYQSTLSSTESHAFGDSWTRWRTAGAMGLAAAGFFLGASCAAASAAATTPEKEESGAQKVIHQVVFVLGGPGSGKGTQCERLTSEFKDVAHFSAGDLLREHVKSGTPEGNMVADMIKNGQIVPAEVTVGLLKDAMESSGKAKVLVDGFPRNDSNREVFQKVVGYDCQLVLYFDCPEEVLEHRLLSRNQGRVDDNIETIKKRFKVFLEQSLPVIQHYSALGKVRKIDTNRPVEDIYSEVREYIKQLPK